MKKVNTSILFRIIFLWSLYAILPSTVFAQNIEGEDPLFTDCSTTEKEAYKVNSIGIGLGASFIVQRVQYAAPTVGWFGWFDSDLVKKRITPVFTLTFDRMVNDRFSIGGGFAYQEVELEQITNIMYYHVYKYVSLKRINASMRFLFHYRKTEKYNLYSGIRLGLNYNKMYAVSDINGWVNDFSSLEGNQFAVQVVGLGAKYNISPSFHMNAELCLGSPYILHLGLMARF